MLGGVFMSRTSITHFIRSHPVWLALAAALLVLIVLFDWNWFRAPLERYVSQKTQRTFTISDLHVRLGFTPTIRMRDVYFSNAPWSLNQVLRGNFARTGAQQVPNRLDIAANG
jgi:uncharacterized protein involved in outer membrane biogenesis